MNPLCSGSLPRLLPATDSADRKSAKMQPSLTPRIVRLVRAKTAGYTVFSSSHGTLTNGSYVLGHKHLLPDLKEQKSCSTCSWAAAGVSKRPGAEG